MKKYIYLYKDKDKKFYVPDITSVVSGFFCLYRDYARLDDLKIKSIFRCDINYFICENGCEFILYAGFGVEIYLKDNLNHPREEFNDFIDYLISKGCGR
jgi:hypothetical protein